MGEKTPGAILGLHLWNCEGHSRWKTFQNVSKHSTLGVRALICIREWDRQVAATQRLKDAFVEGRISKEEYIQQPDAL